MLKNKFLSFILFFIVTFSASFIGGLTTITYKEPWYSELIKSNYNPPDWIFAPVWTTLYPVSYTHLRAHETLRYLVCRLLLEKKQISIS